MISIAVVLLLGITVSIVGISVSRSQPVAKALPRLGGSTVQEEAMAYVTTSDGIVKVNLCRSRDPSVEDRGEKAIHTELVRA